MDALKHYAQGPSPRDAESSASADTRRALRSAIYSELEGDFKACTKCHVEEYSFIHWRASERSAAPSGFAKFNHSPHMDMLPDQTNCASCHVLSTGGADVGKGSGFRSHRKEHCETCHAPGRADNSCLTCHEYHGYEMPSN